MELVLRTAWHFSIMEPVRVDSNNRSYPDGMIIFLPRQSKVYVVDNRKAENISQSNLIVTAKILREAFLALEIPAKTYTVAEVENVAYPIKIKQFVSAWRNVNEGLSLFADEETTTDSRNDLFATTTEQQYFETSTYSSSMGSSMGSSETSGSFTSLEKENFSQENIETKSTCNMQDYEMLKENLLLYNNAKLVDGEEDSRRDGKCGDGDDGIE
ncbi:hypothetical protein GQR58_006233 [Nymphon striatum]|nr:hypothetical protein GQR58_006233 [Nymphon striatum]